ncbi:MAG: DUF4476 domain-containing protein [Bacteroidales bacterium]|nr:DUF4476 domain-containing protein [Bacteroidales bacterium]
MKKLLTLIISLLIFCSFSFSQKLNGIQVVSFNQPVVVYLNGQSVSPPVFSTFIANLRPGYYKISATVEDFNQYGQSREREIFQTRIYYNGGGVETLEVDKPQGNYPQYNNNNDRLFSREDFKRFYKEFSSRQFYKEKLKFISVSINSGALFNCEQAVKIINGLNFDNEKLEIAKMLLPAIVDQKNIYTLINSFSFMSTKEKFEEYVKSYRKPSRH